MTFETLYEFVTSKMRVSHIYQPLLIKSLIECGGIATLRQAVLFVVHELEASLKEGEANA